MTVDTAGPGAAVARDLFRALGERRLLVVSNREPYEHSWSGSGAQLQLRRPAGGLTSALDPVLRAAGGTWIAWGSGEADPAAVDNWDRVTVPPEDPSYLLRRIWLTDHDVHRYYLGYSNQLLWPLCHMRPDLVRIGETHWRRYREVNRRFADAVVEESAGGGAAVWFQDYHLALAPRLVRDQRNDLTLAHFWHIPFPPPEIFGMAPQAREILTGLLANDLLGFQIPRFSANFLRCAAEIAGASVDAGGGTATLDGHRCQIGAFPISIDVPFFASAADASSVELAAVRAQWVPEGGLLGLGVDRLDYSKGLPQKLAALDWLWEHHPELRRRFSFLQIAVPSRMNIESYDRLAEEIERQVLVINGKYGEEGWRPITIVSHSLPAETLALLYRTADLCLVTSLQDGMNLVAKEYVASQLDQQGSLILSAFAGAAADLKQAILVNPHDPHAVADAIAGALATPLSIRQTRMKRMQRDLHTIHHWMQEFLSAWGRAGGDSGPFCDPSA